MAKQFYTIADYTFCLQYDPKDFGNLIEQIYPCARSEEKPGFETLVLVKTDRRYTVRGDVEECATGDRDNFFANLEWQITKRALAHNQRFHQIHSAGVAFGDKTIIIPGRSNAGKSCLAMALMRRGGRLFSDEIFLIDRNSGEFVSFPRSFLVKERSYAMFPEIPHPKTFNGYCYWRDNVKQMIWYQDPKTVIPDPFIQKALCRDGGIFFARFTPGKPLSIRPVTPIHVMKNLVPHSLNILNHEENSLKVLGDLATDFAGFELKFDSLPAAVDGILDTLGALKEAA